MTLHVTTNRDRCIGAGLCVLTAPDVFEHDDEDGLVTVLDRTPPGEHHEDIRLSAELCPANVITLTTEPSVQD